MTEILRYWRDLPKEEKQSIMKSKNIKAITFEHIKSVYLDFKK